jgi:hypothetical protein
MVKAMARMANVVPTAIPTIEPELMGFSCPVARSALPVVLDGVSVLLGTSWVVKVVV